MDNQPRIVKLVGKTRKGKQKVKRDGELFRVIEEKNAVTCLNSAGLLLMPLNNDNWRWVAIPVDDDFEVHEQQ